MEFWYYFNIGIVAVLFTIIVSTHSLEKVPRLFKGVFLTFVSYFLSKKEFESMTVYNIVSAIILTMFQVLMFEQIFIFSKFSGYIYINILTLFQQLFYSIMSINRLQKIGLSVLFQAYFALRFYSQFKDKESVVFDYDYLTSIIPYFIFQNASIVSTDQFYEFIFQKFKKAHEAEIQWF